jgi:hypothetical protein
MIGRGLGAEHSITAACLKADDFIAGLSLNPVLGLTSLQNTFFL